MSYQTRSCFHICLLWRSWKLKWGTGKEPLLVQHGTASEAETGPQSEQWYTTVAKQEWAGSTAHSTREGSLHIKAHSSDGCCWERLYRAVAIYLQAHGSPSVHLMMTSLYNIPHCFSLRLCVLTLTSLSYFTILRVTLWDVIHVINQKR